MELVPRSQRNKYKVTTRIERSKTSRRGLYNWLGFVTVSSAVGIHLSRQYWPIATGVSAFAFSIVLLVFVLLRPKVNYVEPLETTTEHISFEVPETTSIAEPVISPPQINVVQEQARTELKQVEQMVITPEEVIKTPEVVTTSSVESLFEISESEPIITTSEVVHPELPIPEQQPNKEIVEHPAPPKTPATTETQQPKTRFFSNLFARPVLGLDVGNSQIKIVELLPGKKPRIQRYAIVPTPRGSVENGIIKRHDELTAAINEALTIGKFSTRKVATTLTGQNLMLRELKLPPMPKKEMRAAINWQVDQLLQLSKEDTITDFTIMPKKNNEETSVMLVAMHREPIVKFVDYLKINGFNVARVDIEPLSVYRTALIASQGAIAKGTHLICDFGAGTTNISIFHEGVLQTARVLNMGGNHLTRQIMIDHNLEFPQAEAEKIRYGLTVGSPIHASLIPVRDRLFNEISATVNYYLTENRHLSISSVQVVGGNGILPAMAAQLEDNLRESLRSVSDGFHTRIANPLEQLVHGVPATQIAWAGATLSVAIGLALGEVQL